MTTAEKIISDWYEASPWAWEYWDREDLKGLVDLVTTVVDRDREEVKKRLIRELSASNYAHSFIPLSWPCDSVIENIDSNRWWEEEA